MYQSLAEPVCYELVDRSAGIVSVGTVWSAKLAWRYSYCNPDTPCSCDLRISACRKSVAWPEPAGCRHKNFNRRLSEQDASGKSGDAATEQWLRIPEEPCLPRRLRLASCGWRWVGMNGDESVPGVWGNRRDRAISPSARDIADSGKSKSKTLPRIHADQRGSERPNPTGEGGCAPRASHRRHRKSKRPRYLLQRRKGCGSL